MARRVLVDAVSRIEGHARVTLRIDDAGRALDARVEALELRGFEAICVGRPIREMPALTARICGICPVAHSVAAAQAGEAILGAEPPPVARALRRLVALASLVQSHATSFFFLSAPDLALGPDAPEDARTPLALAIAAPALLRDGVLLRGFGGRVIEEVAGRRVHPAFAIPGGVTRALAPATRRALAAALPDALAAAERTVSWWLGRGLPSPPRSGDRRMIARVGRDGALGAPADGIRVVSAGGEVLEDGLSDAEALARIVERPVPWSYSKLCAWRDLAGRTRAYEVGPVARLAAAPCATPRAGRALRAVSPRSRALVDPHAARLVEILAALEELDELLDEPGIESPDVLAPPGPLRREGVGACEAPRGLLFHEYRVDEDGLVTAARLVAPTGQNGRAMNAAVREAARRAGCRGRIDAPLRRSIQGAVRAFDPCLSCATHTAGGDPVAIRLIGPGGEVLDEWPRP